MNKNDWVSVDERMPKHKQFCMIWTLFVPFWGESRMTQALAYYSEDEGCFFVFGSGQRSVKTTHWQPLPDGPEV